MIGDESFWGEPREWAKDLAIATGICAFLGVIGPFGSFNGGSLELRVFYWIANVWAGYLVLALVVRVGVRAAARFDVPVWFAMAVSVAVGAAPLALLLGYFSAIAWPGSRGEARNFGIWYAQTLALSEPLAFAYYYFARPGHRGASGRVERPQQPELASTNQQSLLARLPPRIGGKLLCLQMEDHYIRAHTDRGSELILMPLKQAIAELPDIDGLQVHRSWWVARNAVAEPVLDGRNLTLRLSNGLMVPVSRSSVAGLREAGWLERSSP